MNDRLLTVDELAAFLGRASHSLYRDWPRLGIPAYKVGHGLRFRQSEVLAWLEGQKVAV